METAQLIASLGYGIPKLMFMTSTPADAKAASSGASRTTGASVGRGLARTSTGNFIDADVLAMDGYCLDCHAADTFEGLDAECINCHEHRKSEADKEHEDEPGYVYNSAACYSCHPTGKSD